jgi:hypothetical protein
MLNFPFDFLKKPLNKDYIIYMKSRILLMINADYNGLQEIYSEITDINSYIDYIKQGGYHDNYIIMKFVELYIYIDT